jgi:hypothetical protein
MTGFGASRAWTGALVEAIVLSGISVGVWSGLTTLTWVRAIWLAFGWVLLWIMGLCEQACSCCLSCNIMVGSMTGFGASRAWTRALVEATILSGILVGVWSGLTTLTWARTTWLAFGYVLLWMMGLYEQACSCCLFFRPQPLTSSCEMR